MRTLRVVSDETPYSGNLRDLYAQEDELTRQLALVRSRISVLRTAYMAEHRTWGLSDEKLRRLVK